MPETSGNYATRNLAPPRLGYERRRMKGPLPVRLLFGWLHHDGRYVHWQRIQRIEPTQVLITGSVKDLPEPGPST